MIKVTTIQKQFVDGTVYLYSERIHRIEYPDGTVEEVEEDFRIVKKELPEFEKKVRIKKVQVV